MSSPVSLPQTHSAELSINDNEHDAAEYLFSSINGREKHAKSEVAVVSLLEPNDLRRFYSSPLSYDGRTTPLSQRAPSPGPPPPLTRLQNSWTSRWQKHRAPLLVSLAQLFGALMNLFARLLELDDGGGEAEPMHPMQILFVRMNLTMLGSCLYIWWKRVPHGILGPRDVRWLMVVRGISGFFGIYGMWYSAMYLPLAEATVITFLAPNLAGYLCHVFIRDPFTRREQLASLVALAGVVLITRPTALFSTATTPAAAAAGVGEDGEATSAIGTAVRAAVAIATRSGDPDNPGLDHTPTSAERLSAVAMGLVGVVGGAVSITTLRSIGPRAHALISVNYFSTWCAVVSTSVLAVAPLLDYGQPALHLVLPTSPRRWAMLLAICACGLATQVLMTKGLAGERSNRATAMIYTHMLFAAGFDRFVFGSLMGWVSLLGCGCIVGSAVWVAVTKGEGGRDGERERGEQGDVERSGAYATAEGVPMLGELGRDGRERDGDAVLLERIR